MSEMQNLIDGLEILKQYNNRVLCYSIGIAVRINDKITDDDILKLKKLNWESFLLGWKYKL
jgi:hypothetical protein